MESKYSFSHSPLVSAIMRRDLRDVERLLDAGADPNERNGILSSPLSFAAGTGNDEICRLLIDRGATLDSTNGVSPLASAARSRNVPLLELLLEAGATIDFQMSFADYAGQTALMVAIQSGYSPMTATLLAHGASTTLRDSFGYSAEDHALQHVRDVIELFPALTHVVKFDEGNSATENNT